jgi:hypothetical protein
MELDSETLRRMAECFGRQTCCRCGRPAERLTHSRFYCIRHYPGGRATGWEPSGKVYRCHYGLGVRV